MDRRIRDGALLVQIYKWRSVPRSLRVFWPRRPDRIFRPFRITWAFDIVTVETPAIRLRGEITGRHSPTAKSPDSMPVQMKSTAA
jgi:hypothetical protein